MKKLDDGLPKPWEALLMTDEYEFNSGDVDLLTGHTGEIIESYYFRNLMPNRGFHVFMGLQHFLAYIENFNDKTEHFDDMMAYLESLNRYSDKFLDHLTKHNFRGRVYSVPEGTIVFPNEHLIDVQNDTIYTQIVETMAIKIPNLASAVATESCIAKMIAGSDRLVAEFGARRSPAPLQTSYYSYGGGSDATSYMLAGYRYGIPVTGTMPHKFIQERCVEGVSFREAEYQAFREFAIHNPDNFIALVDTFDSIEGTKTAMRVSKELDIPLKGVRLDSGDMVTLSQKIWKLLKDNGFSYTLIIASDGLTPEKMVDYDQRGAVIHGYGIGTSIVQAKMSGVYKLVEIDGHPSMKFTNNPEKRSQPCHTQIERIWTKDNKFKCDVIAPYGKAGSGENASDYMRESDTVWYAKSLVWDGYSITDEMVTDLEVVRGWVKSQMKMLPDYLKRIGGDIPTYPVYTLDSLRNIKHGLEDKWITEFDLDKEKREKGKTIKEILKVIEDRVVYNMGSNVE